MANEVANVFGGAVNVSASADMAAKLQDSAQNDPRGGAGDSEYLNFSGKRGRYTLGADEYVPKDDEPFLLNVMSFEDGFMCWKGGRPQANRMANVFTEPPVDAPAADEGGPFDTNKGEGWFQAKAIVLKSLETDRQGYFKINSKSGVSAIAGLQKMVAGRMGSGEPCWPVITLDMEEFEAQGYKNFKPVFNVLGWLADDQMQALSDGADWEELAEASEAPAAIENKKPSRKRSAL